MRQSIPKQPPTIGTQVSGTTLQFLRWSEHVTFGSAGTLDRAVSLRKDAVRIALLWSSGQAKVLPVWKGKPLLAQRLPTRLGWVGADHPVLTHATSGPVFLGILAGLPYFAQDISDWVPPECSGPRPHRFFDPSEQNHPNLQKDASFQDIRGIMSGFSPNEAELAATALSMLHWHRESRYCGRCGTPMLLDNSGWLRRCPSCHARQFPRTEPAVMMAVVHGNHMLLGRAPGWPEGLYSILAGFVEPGETFEAAVRREVLEETGIEVGSVRYLASQPWAFPNQVLIGCIAEAQKTTFGLDEEELEDAVWINREDMLDVLGGRHAKVRPPWKGSLANFLIRNWVADRLE